VDYLLAFYAHLSERIWRDINNHFLPNSFRLPVLYTMYSSGLAVLYLYHLKELQCDVM